MIERVLWAAAIFLLGGGALAVLQTMQRQRVNRVVGKNDEGRSKILYFRSDHCAPCVTQANYLVQLSAETNIHIEKIDVIAEPEKAAQYHVMTLPTTIVIDATGTVSKINYGLTTATQLARQLEN